MDPRIHWLLTLIVTWVDGLLVLFVLGSIFSRLTLRSIDRNFAARPFSVGESAFRQMYRGIITVAGLYYYISLPLLILLLIEAEISIYRADSLALSAGIHTLLRFMAAGPPLTIFDIVWSLIAKRKTADSRPLTREEAPGLWALTEEVAERVGTRPIEEIRITWNTVVGVEERGNRKEKSRDKACRVLILGVAVLNGLRTNAFRAVLAHEYGHFMHRDSAEIDTGLRADIHMTGLRSMMSKFEVWNVGFWFLHLYHYLFRWITRGALRLREVLADRTAALNYGGDSFEEGLRHVIRRGVEFCHVGRKEFDRVLDGGTPMQNLYDLVPAPGETASIEDKFNKILRKPTTWDHTHPGTLDRFQFVHRWDCLEPVLDNILVWDLFKDRNAITWEMTRLFWNRLS